VGNLQQVGISRGRQVRPTIETATQLFEHTSIAECVQPSVPQLTAATGDCPETAILLPGGGHESWLWHTFRGRSLARVVMPG